MADPMVTLLVEYACERYCQVEYDTDTAHPRATINQLLAQVKAAHDAAHKADPPVKVFVWRDGTTVKAGAL